MVRLNSLRKFSKKHPHFKIGILKNVRIFATAMANMKKILTDFAIMAGTYILLAGVIYIICAPGLCFLEHTATFVDSSSIIMPMLREPGGCVRVAALWIQQWFVSPLAASLVCGALLTVAALTLDKVMALTSKRCSLMPLAIIPAVALIHAHTGIDYRLAATVAMAMAALCLLPVVAATKPWVRLSVTLAGTVALYYLAGQAAVLFAVCAVIVSLAIDGKKGVFSFLSLPLALCLAAGEGTSITRALLPWGYYPHWHHASNSDLLPWIAMVMIIFVAAIIRHALPLTAKKPLRTWLIPTLTGVLAAGAVGWVVMAGRTGSFASMWLSTSAHQWDEVTAGYKDVDKEDAVMQNFMNLALAEKGTLCDYLFWHPNRGVAALHDTDAKDPYTYMLLSDVYYSMGFIALSKRYAFEANEALGNFSPQMLMRLADTNIITGDYALAEKYLDILGHTEHYSGWAEKRRPLLNNDSAVAADPVLGAKRACIFPDNRFAGSRGIADDMLQVIRCNPAHASTMQYLSAYYMLSRDIPGLVALVEEFYGTPALNHPLPVHVQEALVVDGLINGGGVDSRYNIHPSVLERCRAFWAEHKPQPNTLWHYLRTK